MAALLPPSKFAFERKKGSKFGAIVELRTKTKMRGLVPTLTGHFYPHYSRKLAKKGPGDTKAGKASATARPTKGRRTFAHGVKVDKQLSRAVTLIQKYGIDINGLLRSGDKPKRDIATFRRTAETNTTNILSTLDGMGLHPVAAQYGVGSVRAGVATNIDMLCTSKEHKGFVIPIEVKTGYRNYYRHTGHCLPGPLSDFSDCFWTQHQLQVIGGALLYNECTETGPRCSLTTAYVLKANLNGVLVLPVHHDISANASFIRSKLSC